jgi:hypothetical protein
MKTLSFVKNRSPERDRLFNKLEGTISGHDRVPARLVSVDLAPLKMSPSTRSQAAPECKAEDMGESSTTLCPRASSLFTKRLVVRSLWR